MQQLVGPTVCPQEGHSLKRDTEKEKHLPAGKCYNQGRPRAI